MARAGSFVALLAAVAGVAPVYIQEPETNQSAPNACNHARGGVQLQSVRMSKAMPGWASVCSRSCSQKFLYRRQSLVLLVCFAQ